MSFRGSSDLKQVWNQICKTSTLQSQPVKCHPYLEIAKEEMDHAIGILKRLIEENPTYTVILTGHSLGGALASLTALDLAKNEKIKDKLLLYTFGMPRVGNQAYAKDHERKVPNSCRIVNKKDCIQWWPLEMFGYQHHGPALQVDNLIFETNERETEKDKNQGGCLNCSLSDFYHRSYLELM